MDKKMLIVVGTIFGLIFVASFLALWTVAQNGIKYNVGEFNSAFNTLGGYEYDISIFENAKVTPATRTRYSSYASSGDVVPSMTTSGSTSASQYTTSFTYTNGEISGITFKAN